ncbi:uncharacterized protein [Nicotiana tomentosiformis]|uniref:uncharacterized protein n=1 Tax=Nicotiana tomentosiformis TaxID=4098 RepID=UPI00388C5119
MAMGHSPSLPSFSEEALKEARELKTPDIGVGSGAADPFKDCFTGVDDSSDIGDASLLLEEAQRFITRAIGRFRVDLSQCEAELRKVLGERDDLRLLCSKKEEAIKDLQADLAKVHEERVKLDQQVSLVLLKYGFDSTVEVNPPLSQLQQKIEKIRLLREEVDQIRAESNHWKETIDRLAAEKETILTKLLSADVQLRNVKQKVSVQAKKIDELEIRLAEAKAEVESSKVLADKSIALFPEFQMFFLDSRSGSKVLSHKCSTSNARGANPRRVVGKPVSMTVELRPSVGDEDLPPSSSASGQPGATAEEKKRKRAPSSPSSEKEKTRRRLVRKPKGTSSSKVLDSESLLRLRDEPEEDGICMSHVLSSPEERVAAEGEMNEANPPQVCEVDAETHPPRRILPGWVT